MSYDLDFWRYKADTRLNHRQVYEKLSEGARVEGVEDIPIGEMLLRVGQVFADWKKLDDVTFDGGERGMFQLFTTPQFFRVDCSGMTGEELNRFVDIGKEFGCPLYDPQVGERFNGG